MRKTALALTLAVVVVLPAAAQADQAAPVICQTPQPQCLTKGGGGDTHVSQRLIQVGDTFEIKLTPNGGYGGIASIGDPGFTSLGTGATGGIKQIGKCKSKFVTVPDEPNSVNTELKGDAVCKYKAVSATRSWQKVTWGFNLRYGGLASYSEDAFRIVGKKESYIEGFINGKGRAAGAKGPGIKNMKIKASGKDGDSGATNDDGYYELKIGKPGSYEVIPTLRAADKKVRPRVTLSPDSKKVKVPKGSKVSDVNFKLSRGDTYSVEFQDPTSMKAVTSTPADGATGVNAVISTTDANDAPVANQDLKLVVDGATLGSKAIVCQTDDHHRIWPSDLLAGTRSAAVDPLFEAKTGSDGKLTLPVHPGTEDGKLEITARAPDGNPSADATGTLTLTPSISGATLQVAAQGAFNNGQGAGQAPLRDSSSLSSEDTHQGEVTRWLGAVKAAGAFRGWEYLPITDGTRYGVLFFKHEAQAKILSSGAVAGDGVVLESDNNGISPLLEGAQLPSLADWAAGHAVTVDRRQNYGGQDLFYGGWPYEFGSANECNKDTP